MAQITLNSTGVASNGSLLLQSNGTTTAVTIDAAQNMGLGVTPSAWGSSWKSFDMAYATTLATNDSGTAGFGSNWRNDGTNYIYKSSGYASLYLSSSATSSVHRWYTAASGTAGNTISFTQAMTLDASGNLGIGTTSIGNKFVVSNSGAAGLEIAPTMRDGLSVGSFILSYNRSGAAYIPLQYDASYHAWLTSNTERARIDSSGNFRVGVGTSTANIYMDVNHATGSTNGSSFFVSRYNGTQIGDISQATTSTVAYNTSSDYRLKENIAPMTGALEKVAQIKPVTYTWKVDGAAGQGFIAHELQEIVPDCVTGAKDAVETYIDDEGNEQTRPKYQGIDTSFLVATLTAAIQEQQAIITQLQADVAALKGSK